MILKNLIFVALLLPVFTFSQSVKALVLDQTTKQPIQGVNIYLNNTSEGAITNQRGRFYIRFKTKVKNSDTLFFSHLGYKTKKIVFQKFIDKKDTVYLAKNLERLKEVTVTSDRKLNSKIKFTKLASLKNELYAFGSIILDNKIYVIGGNRSFESDNGLQTFNDHPELVLPYSKLIDFKEKYRLETNFANNEYSGKLMMYDLESDTWEHSKLKFRKRAHHNLNYYNNTIYVLGGKYLSNSGLHEYLDNKIEMFDLKNNTITIDHTNPHQAVDFISFTYKDHIIVMGGCIKNKKNGVKIYSDKVHSYNLKTGFWYELDNMPMAKELQGLLIKDKIYVLSKFDNKQTLELKTFDLLSGQWESEGILPKELDNPGIAQKNDIIYFFEHGKLFAYNVITKELNSYSVNIFLKGSKLYCIENKLYILGGFEEDRISKKPSSGFFSIDLDELSNTKIKESKYL